MSLAAREDMLATLEEELFSLAGEGAGATAPGPIFILGAPRTGSTILYQMLVAGYELPYISNATNGMFAEIPIVGFSLQAPWTRFDRILARSAYGKVDGPMQPSEGSAVMRRWFGGGHPSEIVSAEPLPSAVAHMQSTFAAASALFGKPVVIKNAWNCFRIAALGRLLPQASFVWIRRDIAASALSDLAARYATKNDPNEWNSATPRNIEELRKRPYWEQVVENQFEFSRAISEAFAALPPIRCAELWYEDLCARPAETLGMLTSHLSLQEGEGIRRVLDVQEGERASRLSQKDRSMVLDYVSSQQERLASCRREAADA